MGVKKITFVFNQGQKGWTESYYKDDSNSDLRAVFTQTEFLRTARASLLGKQGQLQAVRVSDEDQTGDA